MGNKKAQEMKKFLAKCKVLGVKLFDFYYDDPSDNDDCEYSFYEPVCLTEIYVPDNEPEPIIYIPTFVSYLHYSVISDNKKLNSCIIIIPQECCIEWNYGIWETGRKQKFFKSAKEIIIDEGHPELSCEDEVIFNGNKTVLFMYPDDKKDEEYTIPESVASVDIDAFLGNKYLRRLYISKKVRKIESCQFDSRTRIEVESDNKAYKSIDGSLYSKNGKIAYHLCQDEEGNIKVAEGTETIKEIFFSEKVKGLYLPNSVKKRSAITLIENNWDMCGRALVPEELRKYLKSYEKRMGIAYY